MYARRPSRLTWMSVGWRNGGSTVATIRGTLPTTVKLWALVAEPAGVVAPIGPDVAPAGTWTVKRVVSADTTRAGVPLNRATLFAGLGSKPVPMMTTVSPTRPLVGANDVITGGGGTLNVTVALPREFVTTSAPVTAPTGTRVVRPVGASDSPPAEPPANVPCVSGSTRSPVIVTRVPAGPRAGSTLVMHGGNRTVKDRTAGVGSSLPARSRALTSKV